jgi:hypothetical protein
MPALLLPSIYSLLRLGLSIFCLDWARAFGTFFFSYAWHESATCCNSISSHFRMILRVMVHPIFSKDGHVWHSSASLVKLFFYFSSMNNSTGEAELISFDKIALASTPRWTLASSPGGCGQEPRRRRACSAVVVTLSPTPSFFSERDTCSLVAMLGPNYFRWS